MAMATFLKSTCFPGLKYLDSTAGCQNKIFWTFANLVGLVFTSFLLCGLFLEYSQCPTFTIVSESSETDEGINFPGLAICYHYRTTNTKMEAAGLTESDLDVLYHSLMSTSTSLVFDVEQSDKVLNQHRNEGGMLHNLTSSKIFELLRNITPNCFELVGSCTFDFFHYSRNCCGPLNIYSDITAAGPCLTLPVTKNFTQKIPGVAGGIRLHLYYPDDNDVPNTNFYTYRTAGVAVFPHTSGAAVYGGQVLIPKRQVAFITVRRIRTETLMNTDECQDLPDRFNTSRGICVMKCLRNEVNKLCGCIGLNTFLQPKIDNFSICNAQMANKCGRLIMTETHMPSALFKCYQHCPKRCVETDFDLWVDYAPKRSVNNSDPSIILNVKFERLSTQLIQEKFTETWKTFLSSIGGTVGMWLGTCFFGIVHICHHFTTNIIKLTRKLNDGSVEKH